MNNKNQCLGTIEEEDGWHWIWTPAGNDFTVSSEGYTTQHEAYEAGTFNLDHAILNIAQYCDEELLTIAVSCLKRIENLSDAQVGSLLGQVGFTQKP